MSHEQKIGKALRETNFKYGIHSPLVATKDAFKTISYLERETTSVSRARLL